MDEELNAREVKRLCERVARLEFELAQAREELRRAKSERPEPSRSASAPPLPLHDSTGGRSERHLRRVDASSPPAQKLALFRERFVGRTERLAEADAVASVGTVGDSYDNAMAEALNSLFKAECIRNPMMRPKGGWASIRDVEIAVAEYVDWYNHRRLHGEIGHIPPAEFEATHWASHEPVSYVGEQVPIGAGSR